jgi:hypothetical protein
MRLFSNSYAVLFFHSCYIDTLESLEKDHGLPKSLENANPENIRVFGLAVYKLMNLQSPLLDTFDIRSIGDCLQDLISHQREILEIPLDKMVILLECIHEELGINLIENESIKEGSFKEESFNEEPFKEESFNEESFNEEPFKEESFNEEPFKEESFNEESFKEESFNEESFNEESFNEESLNQDYGSETVIEEEREECPSESLSNLTSESDEKDVSIHETIEKPQVEEEEKSVYESDGEEQSFEETEIHQNLQTITGALKDLNSTVISSLQSTIAGNISASNMLKDLCTGLEGNSETQGNQVVLASSSQVPQLDMLSLLNMSFTSLQDYLTGFNRQFQAYLHQVDRKDHHYATVTAQSLQRLKNLEESMTKFFQNEIAFKGELVQQLQELTENFCSKVYVMSTKIQLALQSKMLQIEEYHLERERTKREYERKLLSMEKSLEIEIQKRQKERIAIEKQNETMNDDTMHSIFDSVKQMIESKMQFLLESNNARVKSLSEKIDCLIPSVPESMEGIESSERPTSPVFEIINQSNDLLKTINELRTFYDSELKQQLQNSMKSAMVYQGQVAGLNALVQKLQNECNESQQQKSWLEQGQEKLREEINELTESLKLQMEKNQLQTSNHQTEFEKMIKKESALKETVATLQNNLKQTKYEMLQIEQSLIETKALLAVERSEKNNEIEQILQRLKEEQKVLIETTETRINSLLREKEETNAALNGAKSSLNMLQGEFDHLKELQKGYENEILSLKDQLSMCKTSMERIASDKEAIIVGLQRHIETEALTTKKLLEAKDERCENLSSQIESLRKKAFSIYPCDENVDIQECMLIIEKNYNDLKAADEQNKLKLAELEEFLERKVAAEKEKTEEYDSEIQAIKARHGRSILNLKEEHNMALQKLKTDYETDIKKKNEDHERSIKLVNEEQEQKIKELKGYYQREISVMKADQEKNMNALIEENEQKIKALSEENRDRLKVLIEENDRKLEVLTQESNDIEKNEKPGKPPIFPKSVTLPKSQVFNVENKENIPIPKGDNVDVDREVMKELDRKLSKNPGKRTLVNDPSEAKRLRQCFEYTGVLVSFSGFSDAEKRSKMMSILSKLGVPIYNKDRYNNKVTHVITPKRNPSIKFICAAISGKWIMSEAWVYECERLQKLVDEQPFGVKYTENPLKDKRIYLTSEFHQECASKPTRLDYCQMIMQVRIRRSCYKGCGM